VTAEAVAPGRWRRRVAAIIAVGALVIAVWALLVPSVDRSYACDPVVFGGGPSDSPAIGSIGGRPRVCGVEPEITLAGVSIVVALVAAAVVRNERLLDESRAPDASLGRRAGGPLARSLVVALLGLGLLGSVAMAALDAQASSVCDLAMPGIGSPATDPDFGPRHFGTGRDGAPPQLIDVRTDTATVRETVWERATGVRYATRLEREPDGSWMGGYVCL